MDAGTAADKVIEKKIFKSPIKDLISVFNNKRYDIRTTYLHDGRFYLYTQRNMIRSFRYYGGYRLYDLKLNTKNYIDKDIHDCLVLYDQVSMYSGELKRILDERYPFAKGLNNEMKNAFEFSLIENGLRDTGTGIEVKYPNEWRIDVVMVNVEQFLSCSFSYYFSRGTMENIFIRWRKKQKDIRVKKIKVPKSCIFLIEDLIERDKSGTLKGIDM